MPSNHEVRRAIAALEEGTADGVRDGAAVLATHGAMSESDLRAALGSLVTRRLVPLLLVDEGPVAKNAAGAIWNLTGGDDGALRNAAARDGAASPLARLLLSHDPKEAHCALGALRNLALSGDATRAVMADAEGVPEKIIAMLRWETRDVPALAADVLATIATGSYQRKRRLVDSGALRPLIHLVRRGKRDPARAAAHAIATLVTRSNYEADAAVQAGAVQHLTGMFNRRDTRNDTFALQALKTLARHPSGANKMLSHGLIDRLLSMARDDPGTSDTVTETLSQLIGVADAKRLAKAIRPELPVLVRLLESGNAFLVDLAAMVLRDVAARIPAVVPTLVGFGVFGTAVGLLDTATCRAAESLLVCMLRKHPAIGKSPDVCAVVGTLTQLMGSAVAGAASAATHVLAVWAGRGSEPSDIFSVAGLASDMDEALVDQIKMDGVIPAMLRVVNEADEDTFIAAAAAIIAMVDGNAELAALARERDAASAIKRAARSVVDLETPAVELAITTAMDRREPGLDDLMRGRDREDIGSVVSGGSDEEDVEHGDFQV